MGEKVIAEAPERLKKSFAVSLGIHGGLLLALIVYSFIPHRLNFQPMSLIELQGVSAGSGAAGSKTAAAPAPKVASLKPKALSAPVSSAVQETEPKAETVSVRKAKRKTPVQKAEASKAAPVKSDLKERILQKFKTNAAYEAASVPAASSAAGQATSPAGLGSGDTPGIGTSVPFPFAWYLGEIQARITDAWDEPGMLSKDSANATAVVLFRIDRQGLVSRIALATPSGISALDDSALRAVEAANPLPPLPEEFKNAYLDVHLQFDLIG